jgi:uncharacterized protein (TIRG00374 family)
MATPDSKLLQSLPSKIIGSIAFGVVVYLGLSFWALSGKNELGAFHWEYFPALLALASGNYLIRFGKWEYYLSLLKISLPKKDSFIIFMSGMALSITPGKLGEVMRSYFLKKGFDEPITKTGPIVLADRLSDMMALVILSALGAYSYHYGQNVAWAVSGLIGAVFLVVTIRPLGSRLLHSLNRLPFVNEQRFEQLQNLYDASAVLLDLRRLALPLVLSVVAWGLEAVGFYLTFKGFGLEHGFLIPVFIYSFSTIVGAISMLPGGLGATEGALTGLMKLLSVSTGTAALAAIIIRAATLWFAVALGTIFLIWAERKYVGRVKN